MSQVWLEETAKRAMALWKEGQSASAIARVLAAERLGNYSRNAVIGKLKRLRCIPSVPLRQQRRKPAPPSAKPVAKRCDPPWLPKIRSSVPLEAPREHAFEPLPGIAPLPLMQRRPSQCAWPVGEPERPAEQLCCSVEVASMEAGAPPYCRAHMKLRKGKNVKPVSVRGMA